MSLSVKIESGIQAQSSSSAAETLNLNAAPPLFDVTDAHINAVLSGTLPNVFNCKDFYNFVKRNKDAFKSTTIGSQDFNCVVAKFDVDGLIASMAPYEEMITSGCMDMDFPEAKASREKFIYEVISQPASDETNNITKIAGMWAMMRCLKLAEKVESILFCDTPADVATCPFHKGCSQERRKTYAAWKKTVYLYYATNIKPPPNIGTKKVIDFNKAVEVWRMLMIFAHQATLVFVDMQEEFEDTRDRRWTRAVKEAKLAWRDPNHDLIKDGKYTKSACRRLPVQPNMFKTFALMNYKNLYVSGPLGDWAGSNALCKMRKNPDENIKTPDTGAAAAGSKRKFGE